MTRLPLSLRLALSLSLALAGLQANEANAIFQCYSVRLHPARVEQLGLEYLLEATTASDGTINDEIGVSEEGAYLHGTTMVFTDPTFWQPLRVSCGVEVPDPPDSNWNGLSDFFEVDRAVTDLESVGEFELDDGTDLHPGTLDLVWNRAADAATGTCSIRFRLEDLGVDLTFQHAFEIYDYRGTLAYTVQGTSVDGHVNLTRLGIAGAMTGPIGFSRVDPNELDYDSFAWTNEAGHALEFYSSFDTEITLLRGAFRTNYYTILYTEDGWPATDTDGEYEIWQLHLFDPNDADGDRIPDLSDDPAPPSPPGLTVRHAGQTVHLEILAETGQQAMIEQTPGVAPTIWTTVQTFTLTNTIHTVELPAPVGPAFWRVSVE